MADISIDGLGLTWEDLTPSGQRKAIFITVQRNITDSTVSDAFMQDLAVRTARGKAIADAAQEAFKQVGKTPSTP